MPLPPRGDVVRLIRQNPSVFLYSGKTYHIRSVVLLTGCCHGHTQDRHLPFQFRFAKAQQNSNEIQPQDCQSDACQSHLAFPVSLG